MKPLINTSEDHHSTGRLVLVNDNNEYTNYTYFSTTSSKKGTPKLSGDPFFEMVFTSQPIAFVYLVNQKLHCHCK